MKHKNYPSLFFFFLLITFLFWGKNSSLATSTGEEFFNLLQHPFSSKTESLIRPGKELSPGAGPEATPFSALPLQPSTGSPNTGLGTPATSSVPEELEQKAPNPTAPAIPATTTATPANREASPNASPAGSPTPTPLPSFTIIDTSSTKGSSSPNLNTKSPLRQPIRFAPSSDPNNNSKEEEEGHFALADNFFHQHNYEGALEEYTQFLEKSKPGDKNRDQALFRKAETLRALQHDLKAQEAYEALLQEIPSGNYHGLASYRLGDYHYQRHEMEDAAKSYHNAGSETTSSAIRQAALYQEALCHRELGEAQEASKLFAEAATTEENNALQDQSLLNQAFEEEQTSHPEKALTLYRELLGTNKEKISPAIRMEAATRAGIILQHQGEKTQAASLFREALATPKVAEENEWQPLAALGLMQIAAEKKEDQTILDQSALATSLSNPQARSEALLLAGNAHRHLHQYQAALHDYEEITTENPGSSLATQAAFNRILTLYQSKNPHFFQEAELFLESTPPPRYLAETELLKAGLLLEQKKYQEAVAAYDQALTKELPDSLHPEILYKKAWALQQLNQKSAAREPLTQLLAQYPEDPIAKKALLERASLSLALGEKDLALADETLFLDRYPNDPAAENVLAQKASIEASQKAYQATITTLEELLKRYPESQLLPQAEFWIGWAQMHRKQYQEAISSLEKLLPIPNEEPHPTLSSLQEKALLRILLCYYKLNKPEQIAKILERANQLPINSLPLSLATWLAETAYTQDQSRAAIPFLKYVYEKSTPPPGQITEALAKAYLAQQDWEQAMPIIKVLLCQSKLPAEKAEALLLQAQAEITSHPLEAQKSVEEALLLQPEGQLNLEARMQLGDSLAAQGKKSEAQKAYEALSLLSNDPNIKKEATEKSQALSSPISPTPENHSQPS